MDLRLRFLMRFLQACWGHTLGPEEILAYTEEVTGTLLITITEALKTFQQKIASWLAL